MPNNKVAYVKPAEPTFLRKMKEKMGYTPGPDIDTKVRYNTFFLVTTLNGKIKYQIYYERIYVIYKARLEL